MTTVMITGKSGTEYKFMKMGDKYYRFSQKVGKCWVKRLIITETQFNDAVNYTKSLN
jgi:hypothetical protein